ncbi:hypothetical protein EYF88_15945 [Paracoccus sediminis]|uniref:Uncharacterized protein n=1 Tax=Paracoccus sediminis TaxID=1214787 RepID=A0A238Y9I0_9RHOB|nr:hypothetical protein [Paracoccus sediminis]TBN47003.1 hypothetical protein EYF88_15945 [Paracoccus sediminis]SNR67478.1 hypothetical protein SAMN06265378_1164 [Paracoccus sediminis]
MTRKRILITAAGAAILLIAVSAAITLFPGGPLSRKEMRLAKDFVAAFTRCADMRADGSHFGACKEAEILKDQIDAAGLCIDYDNTRKDTYEDFYRCGSPH